MAGICSIDGCERRSQARGLLRTHYAHFRRSGNLPVARNAPRGAPQSWIETHLGFDGVECLPWPFRAHQHAYGALMMNGKLIPAHRFMCEQINGPPPTPKHVAARSWGKGREGRKSTHLRWATYAENEADKLTHGTCRYGKRHPMVKLTELNVSLIRLLLARGEDLKQTSNIMQRSPVDDPPYRQGKELALPRPRGPDNGGRSGTSLGDLRDGKDRGETSLRFEVTT